MQLPFAFPFGWNGVFSQGPGPGPTPPPTGECDLLLQVSTYGWFGGADTLVGIATYGWVCIGGDIISGGLFIAREELFGDMFN